jgi:DnaT DNA-binding domain
MTEMLWYKRFHGTAYDPKFTAAATEAGSTHCNALGVWDALLETSSEGEDRGSLAGIDLRVIAAGLHLVVDEVERIWAAFVSLGMIVGQRINKWAKRQGVAVAKAVSAGAHRMRRYRQRKAADNRQGEFAFVREGEGSAPPHAARDSVTSGVTAGVTSAAEAESETDYSASRDAESSDMPPAKGAQIIDFREGGHGRRSRRGRSELAADWQPSADDWRFAAARGHDADWIDRQAALFRAHYRAKGAVAADWNECWNAWVLRSEDFGASGGGGGPGGNRRGRASWLAAAHTVIAKRAAAAASRPLSEL